MGKVKGKNRLDKYYHLAKEHGYRSRAAWKLIQLDSKYNFLSTARATLDLCAAPGGWMQVAIQRMPVAGLVLGVDLVPIRPVRGAVSFEGDITQTKCRSTIKKLMAENGCRAFDLVLHDGSPNVGGAWATEATSQNALVIDSVKLATEFLSPRGTFVSKVFRSQDYSSVLYCLNQLFEKVEVDKPLASRSTSAEIYILGLRYKAPAKIDPRLLDVKHLFQASAEPKKVLDVLRGTKQKRHRDGYEDGNTILRKVCSASDFIWSETPLDILGSVSSISFTEPACLPIKEHNLTTEEVKLLCDDLRVLGKQDFKHLLKWRMHIRKASSATSKADSSAKSCESVTAINEDDRILNEMEELTHAMERKKKREKKLIARRQTKDKRRKATGMQVDVFEDGIVDSELFSLSSIKGKKELIALDHTEHSDEGGDDPVDSEGEVAPEEPENHLSSDMDSDEERQRYNDQLEEVLDEAYEHFVAKREGSAKQRKRVKRSYTDVDELPEDSDNAGVIHSDPDREDDEIHEEANPLVVPLVIEEAPTQEEIAAKWFSQDIFAKAMEEGDLGKFDSEDEMDVDRQEEKASDTSKVKKAKTTSKVVEPKPDQPFKGRKESFEIVPAIATDSSDSSEEDIETKVEILACAKKMLRKKQREHMLDDAYNRYMFHDKGLGLPRWFMEEEKQHRQAIKPVTREEIAAERAQFKEIDARPAKKVAEAKARKKRAAMRKLEKARKKASSISEQADISDRSKGKMIEQLYKKAAAPRRPQKEYVVAKKGVRMKAGKGKVLVDRRMKKDSRSHGMSKKQGNGGKKGKSVKGQKGKKMARERGRKGK